MSLRIYDVSEFIYAGSVMDKVIDGPLKDTSRGFTQCDIPCGGIYYLFNQIYKYHRTDTLVFVCDRVASIKKEMFPGFKEKRTFKQSIQTQKDVAEFILNDCGFSVVSEEGYEADDIIYSLVKKFHEEYDRIYVYAEDSDLHFLVDEKVTLEPVRSKGKQITLENYSYTVMNGRNILYNGRSFDYLVNGCSHNNVPAPSKDIQSKLLMYFNKPWIISQMGNKEFFRGMVEQLVPEALLTFDLVYPLDAPVPAELSLKPDTDVIKDWAAAMSHRLFPRQAGISQHITDCIQQMVDLGFYVD